MTWKCSVCGDTHDDLPDIGFKWPDYYFSIPEAERDDRVESTSDTCVVDDEHFFIRCVLLIPVEGYEHDFGLGVWLSQSRESFETYMENLDPAEIGPFFGWFSNSLPFYDEETLSLKAKAHIQGDNQRPLVELEPIDHALVQDHEQGISLEQAWKYVHWWDDTGNT